MHQVSQDSYSTFGGRSVWLHMLNLQEFSQSVIVIMRNHRKTEILFLSINCVAHLHVVSGTLLSTLWPDNHLVIEMLLKWNIIQVDNAFLILHWTKNLC